MKRKKKNYTGARSWGTFPGDEHWMEDKVHNR